MTESQAQYAALPQWMKDIIVSHVDAANARPQAADERINFVPRDVVNMKLKHRALTAVRHACIREAVFKMRAEGRLKVNDQVAEWFGCGRTAVTTAIRPERNDAIAEVEAA